tara:strand:+ start:297 stop:611 length:315 start_codon:yes stop_codon:yes gene_type:complete
MINGEKLITAIITQAVDDAKYIGSRKKYLKHKVEAIQWIMSDDPQFKYYCRLLNIEPDWIKNKLLGHADASFTSQQRPMIKDIIAKLENNKAYEIVDGRLGLVY